MKIIPDVPSLSIAYLKIQADVAALCSGRVYGKIPDAPTWPLLTVADPTPAELRVRDFFGGFPLDVAAWGGLPEDGVDWDTAKGQAFDLIATAHGALWDGAFTGVHAGKGVVTGVETRVGPSWLPDPESTRPRYILQVAVFAHPLPD